MLFPKSPTIFLILFFCAPAFAAGPMSPGDGSGWRADFLEQVCSATFAPGTEEGALGRRVTGKLEKNRIYSRLDPLFGGVILVTGDENGNLDPRPVGPKTVVECTYGGIAALEGESKMCAIEKGQLRPLKKGDPRAKARVIYRLYFTGDPTVNPLRAFEWEVSREFRVSPRAKGVELPTDPVKLKALNRAIISPGRTVPKFYRTDAQYWRTVSGGNFAVSKSFWMQPFRDGNFHQVRIGYHLEEWPGEPEIMVEVKDDESWLKIGKGARAYYLVEKVKRGPDWATLYTEGDRPSVNPKISAAAACPACTGDQVDIPTSFGEMETITVEPE